MPVHPPGHPDSKWPKRTLESVLKVPRLGLCSLPGHGRYGLGDNKVGSSTESGCDSLYPSQCPRESSQW